MAQLVALQILNLKVMGSSPIVCTTLACNRKWHPALPFKEDYMDSTSIAPTIIKYNYYYLCKKIKKMSNRFYCLVMFPYPSGDGIHVGHAMNYAVMDSYCRWKKLNGVEVFQPFGYDAFGLPAENHARKVGRDPKEITYENINNFRNQMVGMDTGFQEMLITSDPSYQKWTQWLFLELYKRGLAYKKMGEVNWCSSCETVLAREQVKDGHCERCNTPIILKEMEQWYFKITAYKERLINNLSFLHYPEKTKKQQLNWLENLHDWCVSRQRKWGCPIPIEGETDTIDTFVDSSFYYVRYCDPNNEDELVSKDKYQQVDLCVGGNEHACMHLIYARFIHMFLFDIGVVPNEEPFKKVIHQGMITHQGEKMSKSKGNVVNPGEYDNDELRLYLMFLGHYFDGGDWDDSKMIGIKKMLWRWDKWLNDTSTEEQIMDLSELHKLINEYVESFKFNKVVSSLMEFYNKNKNKKLHPDTAKQLEKMLVCFAPGFNKKQNE